MFAIGASLPANGSLYAGVLRATVASLSDA
jgi:hypothetical protein